MMHVVAGVLVDGAGRILIAQRPPGKHLAGQWEFPGGKLEPGESAVAALERELQEELGIAVDAASFEALIRIPWRYNDREMLLEAIVVGAWTGEPQALDASAIEWADPHHIDAARLAPADRPILEAARLPSHYLITPADMTPDAAAAWVVSALARGERLLQLRLGGSSVNEVRALASRLLPDVRRFGASLLLHGDIEGARALGVGIGVHVPADALEALPGRPLPWGQRVGASCHDAAGLALATARGCDFVTLSPVEDSEDNPGSEPLGWPRFARLAEAASLPVFAMGGLGPHDVMEARLHAAQGVAGTHGFVGSASA
jgi:8-oxo-dGTP diphosphatase